MTFQSLRTNLLRKKYHDIKSNDELDLWISVNYDCVVRFDKLDEEYEPDKSHFLSQR